MLTILPSIIHGYHNDHLLRLSECIESLKTEVKQKMMPDVRRSGVRKSWNAFLISIPFCSEGNVSAARNAIVVIGKHREFFEECDRNWIIEDTKVNLYN